MIPVVAIHGFMGAPSSWDGVVEASSATEWLRLSPWGHTGPLERDIDGFDGEVGRLLSALDPGRRYLLAGYSLGGRLALGMLARAPERFSGAVLIGAHPGLEGDAERRERRELDTERAARLRRDGLTAFVQHWESLPLFATQRALPRDVLAEQRRVRLAHDAEGLAGCLERLGLGVMPSWWEALGQLSISVHWLVGARDARFVALAREAAMRSPELQRVREVEGAGHNLLLERPTAVASAIDDLLRGLRAPSPERVNP